MKYLIIGNKGQLGSHFDRFFKDNSFEYTGLDIQEIDITNQNELFNKFSEIKPKIVINCSAYNLVENAEKDPNPAFKVNFEGVSNIVQACIKNNCFLVHYSTNHVFDGTKKTPYLETDSTNPINQYGKSKLAGEEIIKKELPNNHLIIRTSWLYGEGTQNFIYKFLKRNNEGGELVGVVNEIASPTSTRLLVEITIQAIEEKLKGLYHLSNSGSASRWDWADEILQIIGKPKEIKKVNVEYFNLLAKLPVNATLDCTKISRDLGVTIPNWKEELKLFMKKQNYFNFKF